MDKSIPRSRDEITGVVLPEAPLFGKPNLLDQVRARLRAKYYSIRTEEAYLGWIRRGQRGVGSRISLLTRTVRAKIVFKKGVSVCTVPLGAMESADLFGNAQALAGSASKEEPAREGWCGC
jgi:hypothetical protein